MKSLCISFLAIAFLLFSCTSSNKKSKGTSEKLPPATFLEKLKSVENAQLIDVRTKEEVGGGSIQGAANMDFHSEVFSQMLSHLDQEAPVFVYCASGGRSGKTADVLAKNGFKEVYDLAGGFNAWMEEGLPVIGEKADANQPGSPETVTFPSVDELEITADLYIAHEYTAPFIILCHQAGWSRGEYLEIAPKLNRMGFNCMAIDQRSGGGINDVENETFKRAEAQGLGTDFPDAEQDMLMAIKYVQGNYAPNTIILWGSSYSAALAIKLAGDFSEWVNGVLSFAPGEYFERFGKSATWITESAASVECPTFITSAKNEQPLWQPIYDAIPSENKHFFLPETEGNHGSRALWEQFDDHSDYWEAVTEFLTKHFVD